jgi:hypothetical protein
MDVIKQMRAGGRRRGNAVALVRFTFFVFGASRLLAIKISGTIEWVR